MLESQGHNTDQTLKNEVFTLINEAAAENIPQAQHFLGMIGMMFSIFRYSYR